MEAKKEALILEGGGFRGLYTSGVLDVFLKHQIHIPFVVGVSAGAAYGISYVSKQQGRNLKVNQLYRNDWRYEGWHHWLRSGNLFNWPFVFGEIPRKLVPFDYNTFYNSGSRFEIAVTDCHTGKEVYLNGTAGTPDDLMKALTAAASLPILSKMVIINGNKYLDGGISDSIPLNYVESLSYKKIILVLTQTAEYRKKPAKYPLLWKMYYPKFPKMTAAVIKRSEVYNQTLDKIAQLDAQGKVFVFRPQKDIKIARLEKSLKKLDALYYQAVEETEARMDAFKKWLES